MHDQAKWTMIRLQLETVKNLHSLFKREYIIEKPEDPKSVPRRPTAILQRNA